ncbi:5436_t:CDS:2, partial [Dentiscutata erythropus]
MASSISYTYLFQKITDCELPSKETLDILSAKIPTIQPSKRNRTQSSKLKLSALCSWLPKDYFAKIKADFTPHFEENQIKESVTWLQLGYTARESWIDDKKNKVKSRIMQTLISDNELESPQRIAKEVFHINKENTSYRFETESNKFCEGDDDNLAQDNHENYMNYSNTYTTSGLNNYTLSTSSGGVISDEYNNPTFNSYIGSAPDSEANEIKQTTDRISNRTRQKINYPISENSGLPTPNSDSEEADENAISQNSK